MRFCNSCGRLMRRQLGAQPGYFCCKGLVGLEDEDTLIKEIHFAPVGNKSRYGASGNSPVLAKVKAKCECGLDYLSKVYSGANMEPKYLCVCGREYSHAELFQ